MMTSGNITITVPTYLLGEVARHMLDHIACKEVPVVAVEARRRLSSCWMALRW